MRRVVLGTARRRVWLVLLGALVVIAVALPATAMAGQVIVTLSSRGAGTTVGVTAGGACDTTSNFDDRVTIDNCGAVVTPFIPNFPHTVDILAIPRPTPANHWQVAGWTGCDQVIGGTTCRIFGIPNVSVFRQVTVRYDDVLGPAVTPGGVSYSTTEDRTVRFPALDANEPASFECSVDGGEFAACSATTSFALSEGAHNVRFRGTDRSGNPGAITAPVNFNVIDTALLTGPPDFSASNDVTFVVGTATGTTVECAIDNEPLADCGATAGDQLAKSYTDLGEGPHTFTARARFGTDFDRVALVRTFEVDTVAPDTSFDPAVGPDDGDVTTLFGATFAIGASEPASLQCRLGSAEFAGCSSPHSFADLPFGQHRFEARAVDRAGNVDASPASRTWTIVAVDTDGDGFNQRSDCNESDPRINPAAREIRGNAVDENCDGVIADRRVVRTALSHAFKAFRRYTVWSKFQLRGIPSRATVKVTCKVKKKKKCPAKARKAFTKRRASGTINLKSRFVGIRLKPNTVITVTVTAPETVRFVKTIKVRAGKVPLITDRCVPPGARRPQRCR
jgi:hypothetical protein